MSHPSSPYEEDRKRGVLKIHREEVANIFQPSSNCLSVRSMIMKSIEDKIPSGESSDKAVGYN